MKSVTNVAAYVLDKLYVVKFVSALKMVVIVLSDFFFH